MPSSAMFSESLSARKSSSAEARAAERRVLQAHAEAAQERRAVWKVDFARPLSRFGIIRLSMDNDGNDNFWLRMIAVVLCATIAIGRVD